MKKFANRWGMVTLLLVLAMMAAACLPGTDDDADDAAADDDAADPADDTDDEGDSDTGDGDAEDDAGDGDDADGDTASDDVEDVDSLVVWDVFARSNEAAVIDQLNEEFEEEHGVTIERETRPLEDLDVTLPQAMGTDDGPDIASVNQGQAVMGAMVEASLLLDLTGFADEHGWFDTFGELMLQRNSFTEDGQQFGEGNVYGVAPQAEVVGFFYHKDKLDELGGEVPETWDELEGLLEAALDAGETPITYGNSEGWPGIHTYGAIQHTLVDTDYLNDLIFHTADVSFETPENIEAAEIAQQWAEAGYFTENFSGIGYDDSIAAFDAGESVFMLTGSWAATEFSNAEDIGYFAVPGVDGELPPQIGGQGVPFAVRAGTEAPNLASLYVDWMVSERAAELWVEAESLPSQAPPEGTIVEGSLSDDMMSVFTASVEEDQLGHYLDWATPTMYDTLTAAFQDLLAGGTDAEGFAAELQADYEAGTD